MADFVQGLDSGKLVLVGTVLSFAISPFSSPGYNLPIFLFGTFVQESSDTVQSLRVFVGLLLASVFYDIIWIFNNEQNGLTKLLFVLLWLLKLPTVAAFLTALRQRGSQFMSLGADISGPTVWSMPGGFTSSGREGYHTVEDESRPPHHAPPAPPHPPNANVNAPPRQPTNLHPGAYQNA
ncbi:hypothetical protein F5I97DRAFT_1544711 [Phlebopus sp. FC_14]|nr:hypothetical protein F5I97DRAFT_1544711 [Phlebopus sp. FC_14]